MRPLVSLLLAASALSVAAMPLVSAADCIPCEPVNNVCRKVIKVDCLAADATAPSPTLASAPEASSPCAGGACDAINRVCGDCLPEGDAAGPKCMHEACAAVDEACRRVLDVRCLA